MSQPANLLTFLLLATVVLLCSSAAHGENVFILQTVRDLADLSTALEKFSEDCGRYPTTAEGLAALSTAPAGVTNWKGPYVTSLPATDPWKTPYEYISPGTHNPRGFDLASAGRDGKFGTEDDFNNWSSGTGGGNSLPDWPSLVMGVLFVVLVLAALWPTFIRDKPDQTPPEKIRLVFPGSEQEPVDILRPAETPMLSYGGPIPYLPRGRLPLASTYAIAALFLAFMYLATAMSLRQFDVHVPVAEFPGQYLWQQLNPDADYIPMQPVVWSIAFWSLCLAFPVTFVVRLVGKRKRLPPTSA